MRIPEVKNHGVVSQCAQCVKHRTINAMSSLYDALSLTSAALSKWTTYMMHFALVLMLVIAASIDFVSPCSLPLSITLCQLLLTRCKCCIGKFWHSRKKVCVCRVVAKRRYR